MPFSVKDFEEKPYNTCLNCIHIGKDCDGPNFLAMSTERWCEWCRLRKQYLKWTNDHVADLAGVAEITVDRIMSGHAKDLRISTMQAITKALVNGSWGQHPCASAAFYGGAAGQADNQDAQRKIDFLKDQVKIKDEQLREKDKQISELIAALTHRTT